MAPLSPVELLSDFKERFILNSSSFLQSGTKRGMQSLYSPNLVRKGLLLFIAQQHKFQDGSINYCPSYLGLLATFRRLDVLS